MLLMLKPLKTKHLAQCLHILSNVRNLLPSNIKHTMYNSLFRSFVEYRISAWGKNKSTEMKKISLLLKSAIRIIENAKTASHTDPLFFKYKILKLNDLTEFNQATFMYK